MMRVFSLHSHPEHTLTLLISNTCLLCWSSSIFVLLYLRGRGLYVCARVCPALVRHQRVPARTAGIAVVRVPSQFFVQFRVLRKLLSVEPHAEPRGVRNLDGSVSVFKLAAFYDIV